MGICCVDGCESDEKDDVVYFPVPVAAGLRRKWRSAVGGGRLHPDSRICSRHFAATDYERVRGKLRLKARVVPSLFHSDQKKESASPVARRTRRTDQKQARVRETEDGDDDARNDLLDHDQEMQVSESRGAELRAADDSGECTIECIPEGLLNHDTDSHSDTDLPKEDIEDIIANYHIVQRRALAHTDGTRPGGKEMHDKDRHRARETDSNEAGESETTDTNNEPSDAKRDKERDESEASDKTEEPTDCASVMANAGSSVGERDSCTDTIEIEAGPDDRAPEFIEIPVDNARKGRSSGGKGAGEDDCLLVLEKVQVDIDPTMLMLPDDNDSDRREAPISLVTSSDDSDVILEEPHIDTVEVSSEDEDDKPLVALVKSKRAPNKLTRLLWGSLVEYYCYQCKFTTMSKAESEKHKLEHSKILLVCEVCNYTCGHNAQMTRHKKKHKEEKRYKCRYCDYRARHNMSLVYHMKSHEGVTVEDIEEQSNVVSVAGKYRCSDCRFSADGREAMMKHVRSCRKTPKETTHKCIKCSYTTKRRNDLKRHIERKHASVDDDIEN